MRYWNLIDSKRVIAVDCQMSYRWIEITKEEFEETRLNHPYSEKDKNAWYITNNSSNTNSYAYLYSFSR